jgi:hypothetical protein
MSTVVRVIGAVSYSGPTPHDGRFVVAWNPHTRFGDCEITTTDDLVDARRFTSAEEALREWKTVSNVEPVRPDGKPNRPLSGLTVEFVMVAP